MKKDYVFTNQSLSILGFSFFSAYIISFVFEGQVMYSIFAKLELIIKPYLWATLIAQFLGLSTSWIFVKNLLKAKAVMLFTIILSFLFSLPLYFNHSFLWFGSLIIIGYTSGVGVGAWAYLFKEFTPVKERLLASAKILIYSNILMIFSNVLAVFTSPYLGLSASLMYLVVGGSLIYKITVNNKPKAIKVENYPHIKKPLLFLGVFIFIITINYGLMHQVIKPAFFHLAKLTCWFWALPYIISLLIIKNLSSEIKKSGLLHIAIVMLVLAFVSFMILEREPIDYIVGDSLLLAALAVFDLFYWSILANLLEYSDNPSFVFGIGLSFNVLGVLIGGLLGNLVLYLGLMPSNLTVIALVAISLSSIILPYLNTELTLILKSHTFLKSYVNLEEKAKKGFLSQIESLEPLTDREVEVLNKILLGKSNKTIAKELFISENTVKTHARNIFSKYKVTNRVELMSLAIKKL